MGNYFNLSLKVAFIISIIMHVLLWPTISHIVFAIALALEGIVAYAMTAREDVWATVFSPSLFFFHDEKSQRSYFPLTLIFFYMLYTFLWFANDEIAIQPRMTSWIDNTLIDNYTFTTSGNNPFTGVDVTSAAAKRMRDNSFEWPRKISVDAIQLVGPLPQANAGKTTLNCQQPPTAASNNVTAPPPFACFATRLFSVAPPSNVDVKHSVVPVPSQFYTADITITPPVGVLCQNLEAYRIVVDQDGNVANGLDYPASSVLRDGNTNSYGPLSQFCNLFGISGWCLHFQHTFSNAEYAARVATKCAEKGVLNFRLPVRAIDIEPTNGKTVLDALIVTQGAKVHLDFEWEEPNNAAAASTSFIGNFQKPWVSDDGGFISAWRKSSEKTAVYFKFLFLILPLLFAWYYLGIHFLEIVVDSQILLLCIFVLFPSILIFLSLGAWLPMAGCIVCVIAVNHTPETSSMLSWWRSMIRPVLFFITATCNSVQFAWLLTLVGQAGWSAFLYEGSIKQLASLSSKFIISDTTSPTWVGLILPSMLLLNLAFMLGSAVCIVLELLPRLAAYRGTAASDAASPQNV